MRRRHPWLHRARTHLLSLSNTQFVYEAFGSDQRITVALNLGDDVLRVRNSEALVVLAASDGAAIDQGQVLVPGHGWAVLQ